MDAVTLLSTPRDSSAMGHDSLGFAVRHCVFYDVYTASGVTPCMCCAQVVATLKDLASSGHTVVCSIHQPRSSIFGMFDDLMLLSEGHCVYFGPAEGVLDYFEQVSDGSRPSTQSHGQSNRLGSWIRCTARLRILCLMSCA